MAMSLKKKAISGILWSLTERFSMQGIQFVISIIMARLLMPAEFGILGMIAIFINLSQLLIDSGLTLSLLRSAELDQRDYSTVFFFNLAGSFFFYMLIFFFAPLISSFFHQPSLVLISRVVALSFLINALAGVQNTLLTKQLDFKKLMLIQIPSLILSSIIGIGMAAKGFGVWSLIIMQLTGSLFTTIQLWLYSSWRPSLLFSVDRFKYHFAHGYKMTAANLINSVFDEVYSIIIGRSYSAAQLGYYTRANSVKQLPVVNLSSVLSKVTLPIFAEIQNEPERLRNAYKTIMQQVIFWLAPLLTGMAVLAEPLFRFLFTEKWLPSVPYFQLLCIVGILHPLHSYNINILQVKSRSDLVLKLEIIKRILMVMGIAIALPFGIYGLLYFQIIFSVIAYFINSYYSGVLVNYGVKSQLNDLVQIFLLTIFMGSFCYIVDSFLISLSDWLRLILVSMSGIIFYLGTGYLIKLSPLIVFIKLLVQPKETIK